MPHNDKKRQNRLANFEALFLLLIFGVIVIYVAKKVFTPEAEIMLPPGMGLNFKNYNSKGLQMKIHIINITSTQHKQSHFVELFRCLDSGFARL